MKKDRPSPFRVTARYFGAANRFTPHQFKTETEVLGGMPTILISREAYDTMYYIVSESPEEVSWLGTVRRDGMTFMIEEVFLFEQEVGFSETKLDQKSVGEFFTKMLTEPDGVEKANAVRFWGHSHVNMGVAPSGSYGPNDYGDLASMYRFGEGADYFIMGIANKSGNLRFEVFFYDRKMRVIDVPWSVYEPEREDLRGRIVEELKQKVSRGFVSTARFSFVRPGVIESLDKKGESEDGIPG